jgi:hypothetical protein
LDTGYPQADNPPVRLISLRFFLPPASPVDEKIRRGGSAFTFRLSIWNAPSGPYDRSLA